MIKNLLLLFVAVAYITMTAAQDMDFAPAPGPTVGMQSAATYPVSGAIALVSLFVALLWQ